MKLRILCALAVAGLLSGCAWSGKEVGASAYNDQNVLTGGPTVGTTIADLPQPVKDTLKQRVPKAEISDIERETVNGRTAYKVVFLDKDKYPPLWITDDGRLLQPGETQTQPQSTQEK
jgi:hypothetical protein